jgi:hypothetical protein
MTGPRQSLGGVEHGDVGSSAAARHDEIGKSHAGALRHEEAAQIVGLGHGRG